MTEKTIKIADDFSPFPGGRFRTDGPNSGERFRDELLIPALTEFDQVLVILDGTEGFGSSFLDEVFGGIVRNKKFSRNDLRKKMQLISEDPSYSDEIWEFIQKAGEDAG